MTSRRGRPPTSQQAVVSALAENGPLTVVGLMGECPALSRGALQQTLAVLVGKGVVAREVRRAGVPRDACKATYRLNDQVVRPAACGRSEQTPG